jgi:2-keto-4-pentenoate hydratase/2-oxohepta-3-ene-1,7-dioic acid hydratase in catechol pathway
MRLVRFALEGRTGYGLLEGEQVFPLWDSPFAGAGLVKSGEVLALGDVTLLAPCEPSKIVALGLNYRDHAAELGNPLPEEPLLFLKPGTSVIGPGEPIVCPRMSRRVDYEAELAVVMARPARRVSEARALDYILGYTAANDVTARDLQKKDGQWTRAKSFDTFAPLGPWIETDIPDPDNLLVEAYLNSERRQHSSTRNLVFPVAYLVAFISRVMTLLPGDVIATGTPAGIGPMQPGDLIEVRVEGVGALKNPVIAEEETG